jgi:predicted dehydrogenase
MISTPSITRAVVGAPAPVDAVGIIGAGQFARATLLPALHSAGWGTPAAIVSASGLSAKTLANKYNIPEVLSNADELIASQNVSVVFILSRHDSHADLAIKALQAGKDVFVEKPLALNDDELRRVAQAINDSDRVLWAGFNRRYAPAVVEAAALLDRSGGPLVATYRVNAGSLPDKHWYKDRRQGGRLLGEVCHFIDTISWIFGTEPVQVVCFGDGRNETLLQEDLLISLLYPDGSTASVAYATGGSSRTPKERIEILGRGHTIVIDDFKSITVDAREHSLKRADKGHSANLAAFAAAIRDRPKSERSMTASLATTAAALAAARSLSDGRVQQLL